ncbi:MAG: cysteinyl-tRNA synthetase, partial [Actinobacteria bacterium]|nr:cysteinyl-tRNA synthetase [Actinomycetota bacterium]
MSAGRILVLMGSGETAPTMVGVHRELAARLGPSPRAVLLDTPYGFQENATELAERAVEYFATSVNLRLEVAGLGRMHGADPLSVERGLRLLADADLVFAGPGSPTYALRQWHGSAVADLLAAKLRTGGTVTFASAAALTLGCRTLPVYEVYKAGMEPHWLEGLDVLATIGVSAAVVPHYNNAEGGHHDTRFCYMGERRLAELERSLPDGAYVLGIDEHTAAVIDLERGEVRVAGKGTLTIRTSDGSRTWPSGSVLEL